MSNKSQMILDAFEHTAESWSRLAGHEKLMIVCAADKCYDWGDDEKSFSHPRLEYNYDRNGCFENTPVIQDVLQPYSVADGVKKGKKRGVKKYHGKLEMGDVSAEVEQSSI